MTARKLLLILGAVLAALALAAAGCGGGDEEGAQPAEEEAAQAEDRLEIFSWWTAGGEAEGLEQFFDVFREQNEGVDVVNATVAGGAGANAKAVLKNRMLGGDPPDSFQVHGGEELIDTWVKPGMMDPVTDLWDEEGWREVFPEQLTEMVTWEGEIYAVPANVHRGNVLWFNRQVFDENGVEPPASHADFLSVAETLEGNGVTPLALGDKLKWEAAHLFETVLLGSLGPDAYRGLWNGDTDWEGQEVRQAFGEFDHMLEYVNEDHAAHTWDSATQMVLDGKAAMTIMGDWAHGYFLANDATPGEDYGWAPAPDNDGSFMVVTDTFGLPKDAPHPVNAREWLRVVGSKEGQEAFNPKKGSICARTDCDMDVFDEYLQSSAEDFQQDDLTPSEVHGSAAPEGFATQFNDIIASFVTRRDADAAMRALKQACIDNGMCQA